MNERIETPLVRVKSITSPVVHMQGAGCIVNQGNGILLAAGVCGIVLSCAEKVNEGPVTCKTCLKRIKRDEEINIFRV